MPGDLIGGEGTVIHRDLVDLALEGRIAIPATANDQRDRACPSTPAVGLELGPGFPFK